MKKNVKKLPFRRLNYKIKSVLGNLEAKNSYICTRKPKQLMKVVLLAIGILLLCVVLLGVKVLFIKGARFPSSHIGSHPELVKRGAECASHKGQKTKIQS